MLENLSIMYHPKKRHSITAITVNKQQIILQSTQNDLFRCETLTVICSLIGSLAGTKSESSNQDKKTLESDHCFKFILAISPSYRHSDYSITQ